VRHIFAVIYIHINMYVHTHTHTHTHIYIYIYTHEILRNCFSEKDTETVARTEAR
jgi:hypothetical protein